MNFEIPFFFYAYVSSPFMAEPLPLMVDTRLMQRRLNIQALSGFLELLREENKGKVRNIIILLWNK